MAVFVACLVVLSKMQDNVQLTGTALVLGGYTVLFLKIMSEFS